MQTFVRKKLLTGPLVRAIIRSRTKVLKKWRDLTMFNRLFAKYSKEDIFFTVGFILTLVFLYFSLIANA